MARPGELGTDHLDRWRELQRADTALSNPFLAPEYALAVGAVRPAARVAVLDDGFVAFEARRFGVGVPIGAGLSDQQAVIGGKGIDAREIATRCGLHAMRFENVPAPLLPSGVARVSHYPSPVVDLGDGYRAFVDGRRAASKGLVPTMQRKLRKLEREIGPVRLVFESGERSVLRKVMRWKSHQYAALGTWDRFADPATVELVDRMHATAAEGCTGTLSVLYSGDQVAAALFGLRSQLVLTSWFPSYNPELGRYSPGLLLHFLVAEAATQKGIVTFDLGSGDHGYKDQLSDAEIVLARGLAFGGTAAGLGRRVATAPAHRIGTLARRSVRLRAAVQAVRHQVRIARTRATSGRVTARPSDDEHHMPAAPSGRAGQADRSW